MVVEQNCVGSVNMVLEILESGAICCMGVSVVLKRLEVEVMLSGKSAGAGIVMVL